MKRLNQSLSVLISFCLLLITGPAALAYQSDQPSTQMPVQAAKQTPAQLQQLVAPIALYPDALVAQILAASTLSRSGRGSRSVAATEPGP